VRRRRSAAHEVNSRLRRFYQHIGSALQQSINFFYQDIDEAAYKESISFFYQHIEKRRADSRSKCASVLSFKFSKKIFHSSNCIGRLQQRDHINTFTDVRCARTRH
jgi:hypothetical protein